MTPNIPQCPRTFVCPYAGWCCNTYQHLPQYSAQVLIGKCSSMAVISYKWIMHNNGLTRVYNHSYTHLGPQFCAKCPERSTGICEVTSFQGCQEPAERQGAEGCYSNGLEAWSSPGAAVGVYRPIDAPLTK